MSKASTHDLTGPPSGATAALRAKPTLSFWAIWNMCFGFFGLQIALGLQNANVSAIFQTLGADVDQIPSYWIAAPLTGLLVQPLIGYMSDHTWTRLGRRKPYFLIGAVLTAIALWCIPRSPALWVAAALLWMLDASINVSMEPFRAFVGDQLPPSQRPVGYAMQSFFIGVGAVVASCLPPILTLAGVSNHVFVINGHAAVREAVRLSFEIGAALALVAVLWTVFSTREYPPDQLEAFADALPAESTASNPKRSSLLMRGALWAGAGLIAVLVVMVQGLKRDLYLVGALAFVWGVALLAHNYWRGAGIFDTIMADVESMPHTMRRLAPVQFFTWLALFSMWIYATPAVAQVHFGSSDPRSDAYGAAGNWVDYLFGTYNGVAAVAAAVIPLLVRRYGLRISHLINVWAGGIGLLSFLVIRNPHLLFASMVGVGFAWASILSLPYALLSDALPAKKMGLYMGVFNFFIVIPQLVAASVLGFLIKNLFNNQPIYALAIGGVSLFIAGLLVLRVPEPAAD
jgi:maltose/moltooligosaccharide transporter